MANSDNSVGCLDVALIIFQALFVGLKLGGVITWSWGAVLIPLWIYLGICLIAFFIELSR